MEPTLQRPERDRSVDAARGIAIVAIVLGHVERGLASAGVLALDQAVPLDRLVYLLHLSTFAYLSGLFVRRAVEREGPRRLMARRLTLFTWLYLLWTLVQGTVRVVASSLANTPVTFADVARIWIPEGQLWFLPWLVAVTAVAAVARPWCDRQRAVLLLVVSGMLAIVVWGYDPVYVFTRGWALLLPFLVGTLVTARGHAAVAQRVLPMATVALVGGLVWVWIGLGTAAVPPTTGGEMRTATTVALGIAGCLAGTVAALSVAALLVRTPFVAPLAAVGRRSLEIFLAHIVVAAGVRIVLVRIGVDDPVVLLAAGTVLGVLVPMAASVVAARAGWTWLFGLPRALA